MRALLSCFAAALLAGAAARADELDREAKGKPATAAAPATAGGSELDKESPDQSCHRWRRGWGGGYSSYSVTYYAPAVSYYAPVVSYYPAVSYYAPAVSYSYYPAVMYGYAPAYYGGVVYYGW